MMKFALNKERLLQVADYIEQHPEEFDMSTWCGTACCIAGTAINLIAKERGVGSSFFMEEIKLKQYSDFGLNYLGLSYNQSLKLFQGQGFDGDMCSIMPDRAVATIRHLVKTGEIDWHVIDKVTP